MLLLAALLWIGVGAPCERRDEIDRHLAELGDPRVHVRHGAERWLSANVDASHVARLAPLILGGDAEVRHRIHRIVAQADADLTIAARLFEAGDDQLAAVARKALAERISRWSPLLTQRAETGSGLSQILARLSEDHGPYALRVRLDPPLGEVCALLERRGALPIGIAVEGEVVERELRRPDEAEIVAGWSELVGRLAAAYGVGLDLFGFERADAGSERRGFLRFTPRGVAGRGQGEETGEEVLVRWFRRSTSAANESNRIAAARNLAASGWPDALAWLAARYRARRDPVALEGLLVAAATGRVAPILLEPDVLRDLVRAAGADLGAEEPGRWARAHRTIDALGRVGCLGREGEELSRVVLEGFAEASPPARWARLAILEGLRCGAASGALEAIVLDATLAPGLRIQALRAWSASTSASTAPLTVRELPAAQALLASVETPAEGVELARMLASAAFQTPPAWADPGSVPADWGFGARLALFGWFAGGPEPARAARLGLDLLARAPGEDAPARGQAVAQALSGWVERGAGRALAAAWKGARAQASDESTRLEVDRLVLLSRLIPPEEGIAVFRALRDRPPAGGPDLALLARAAGWGETAEGIFARQRLTVLFQEALSQNRSSAGSVERVQALEAALGELQRMGFDDLAREWCRPTLRGLLRRYAESELAQGLPGDWPTYPVRPSIDPAQGDRRLAPGAL